jgi:hypothetical protein
MYKQSTYKLQIQQANTTTKLAHQRKKKEKKQLSKQPKRSQIFQQLQDFNNNKWYKSISKGSSNSKER